MRFGREQALFEDRYDAGRQLAALLSEYKEPALRSSKGQPVVVLAIPNGGVPLGMEVALALEAGFDLVISRKIPLPLSPEAGFGAITDDGTVILNEELVKEEGLSPDQINYQISQVRAEIRQRTLVYREVRSHSTVNGKTIIIVDDGLASGYTMMAAVESLRRRKPREIIAAVPVTSVFAAQQVGKVADKLVTVATGTKPKFFVADFYRRWQDVSDDEAIRCLQDWQARRFRPNT